MARMNQAMSDLLRYNAAILPQKRSTFDKSHSHTTTLDSGWLVPLFWDRVLPGDEKQIRYSGLARMATPLFPVMDEANLDVWAFYIPDRLWWNHAKEFYGENKDASFNPDGMYQMPSLKPSQYLTRVKSDSGDLYEKQGIGSLNDYFGFPTASTVPAAINDDPAFLVTAGLHRSYQLIWNQWFRNTSIQPALQLNDGDTVTAEEWAVIREKRLACRYPDNYTTLLREPQAGDDVMLPLAGWAPVVTRATEGFVNDSADPLQYRPVGGRDGYPDSMMLYDVVNAAYNTMPFLTGDVPTAGMQAIMNPSEGFDTDNSFTVYPSNLWADLTNTTAATINNLRAAVTVQQLLEIDNASGKFYQNIIQGHFGVFTPDATLQRTELLGATRTKIGMRQVLQTSQSTDNSALGDTAAFSLTTLENEWITNKSFTEPGIIMVLGCIRTVNSYSQGLNPLLTKINRYDHYWPVFDNLGNQPVPTSDIFFTFNEGFAGVNNVNIVDNPEAFKQTFGFKEAWTEYRVMQNRVSGLMRPDLASFEDVIEPGSLSAWNYSLAYAQPPVLNSAFVSSDPSLIDRTIAVPSEPQFILDSYFDYRDTKPMAVHSIPGLLRL